MHVQYVYLDGRCGYSNGNVFYTPNHQIMKIKLNWNAIEEWKTFQGYIIQSIDAGKRPIHPPSPPRAWNVLCRGWMVWPKAEDVWQFGPRRTSKRVLRRTTAVPATLTDRHLIGSF